MPPVDIKDLLPRHAASILPLNNAHGKETSLLDEPSLHSLLNEAFYARGVDRGATALLIALDHHAAYSSPNYLWFQAAGGGAFIYIDRVIVAEQARGKGVARALYEDLFAASRRAGYPRVVCEVNIDPPNPASEAFHQALGFRVVGEAAIHGGAKTVRYLEKTLA